MRFLALEVLSCVSLFTSPNDPMAQAEQVAPWIPMAVLKLARFDQFDARPGAKVWFDLRLRLRILQDYQKRISIYNIYLCTLCVRLLVWNHLHQPDIGYWQVLQNTIMINDDSGADSYLDELLS